MLFLAQMNVRIPHDMDPAKLQSLKESEKARAIELQKQGKFLHLWRVVGEYANISVFDCESNDELHEVLSSLPLFPYLKIEVTPLAKHPSSIR